MIASEARARAQGTDVRGLTVDTLGPVDDADVRLTRCKAIRRGVIGRVALLPRTKMADVHILEFLQHTHLAERAVGVGNAGDAEPGVVLFVGGARLLQAVADERGLGGGIFPARGVVGSGALHALPRGKVAHAFAGNVSALALVGARFADACVAAGCGCIFAVSVGQTGDADLRLRVAQGLRSRAVVVLGAFDACFGWQVARWLWRAAGGVIRALDARVRRQVADSLRAAARAVTGRATSGAC